MSRCLCAGALLSLLASSAQANVHTAADYDVRPYLSDPSRRPPPRDFRPGPKTHPYPSERKVVPAVPPKAPTLSPPVPEPNIPPVDRATRVEPTDSLASRVVALAIVIALIWYLWWIFRDRRGGGRQYAGRTASQNPHRDAAARAASKPAAAAPNAPNPESIKAEAGPVTQSDLPSQEGWARRAGNVRNPVSSFIFGFQTRANARAMTAEQQRAKAARSVLKEYAGMYGDLKEGQDAATAYGVRRDLAGEHYEHERAQQQDSFDEAAHRRVVAEKRRDKEKTEADTRRIEAEHEQEATELFKEAKFKAGFARYETKVKEHQVGAASAEAAIAETQAPTKPADGANESAEVVVLYGMLQATMRAIEEGERLGKDTQEQRRRVELLKELLNLT